MFNRPPLLRSKGRSNLNEILNFDNTTIYCGPGHLNFSYEDLFDITMEQGGEFCELTDGAGDNKCAPVDDNCLGQTMFAFKGMLFRLRMISS